MRLYYSLLVILLWCEMSVIAGGGGDDEEPKEKKPVVQLPPQTPKYNESMDNIEAEQEELIEYTKFLRNLEHEILALKYKLRQPLDPYQSKQSLLQLERLAGQTKHIIEKMNKQYLLACKVRQAIIRGKKQVAFIKGKYRVKHHKDKKIQAKMFK